MLQQPTNAEHTRPEYILGAQMCAGTSTTAMLPVDAERGTQPRQVSMDTVDQEEATPTSVTGPIAVPSKPLDTYSADQV